MRNIFYLAAKLSLNIILFSPNHIHALGIVGHRRADVSRCRGGCAREVTILRQTGMQYTTVELSTVRLHTRGDLEIRSRTSTIQLDAN